MMRRLFEKGTYVVLGILCCVCIWMQSGVESYAFTRTTGEVTGTSVKVRKEAGTDSDVVAGVTIGNTVDVTDKVNGTDGKVWYKIMINANEYGYIRSDYVKLKGEEQTSNSTTTTTSDVTPMEKQNGHTNTSNVKVREQATTSSAELDKINQDQVFVALGTAKGPDGKIWYRVSYLDNGTEVNGFIRSDLVTLTGTVEEEPEETPEPPAEEPEETAKPDVPTPSVDYEAVYTTDETGEYVWYLYNRTAGQRYKIEQLLQVNKSNQDEVEELSDANFTLKIWLIIVICLLVMGAVVATFFFLKTKEEEIVPRKRTNMGMPQAKSPGSTRQQNNVRPQTIADPRTKPQGTNGQVSRTQTSGQQTVRTQAATQNKTPGANNAKTQTVQGENSSMRNVQAQKQKTSWKAKNFLDDNDEFEFGFLDFDEEDE